MVTESHRQVSSFSKLTLELALQSPLADQTTSRIAVELGKNEELHLRRGLPLVAIVTMSKRNKLFRITNSKLVLHSFHKLIGYWRLK